MTAPRLALDALNEVAAAAFAAALAPVFEHAPWVAEAAAAGRPYATVTDLHQAMMQVVRDAPEARRLTFIGGHPELGSKVRRADFTRESQEEQGGLGLDRLSDPEFERFEKSNAAYREKFAIPFIVCVRRHTRDSILRQFAMRLENDPATEQARALEEIGLITRLRLVALVEGPGMPKTEGRLSTHVLDTLAGKPAPGIPVALYEIGASARSLLAEAVTNADGRTDAPLLSGAPLRIGTYELQFSIGAHFAAHAPADPPFLDVVPLRFSVAEPEGHYHVPLLATPWSYTTYRGS